MSSLDKWHELDEKERVRLRYLRCPICGNVPIQWEDGDGVHHISCPTNANLDTVGHVIQIWNEDALEAKRTWANVRTKGTKAVKPIDREETVVDSRPIELADRATVDRVNACLAACEGVEEPQKGDLARLRSQRDELVAALEKALRCWAWEANQGDGIDVDNYPAYLEARAALARAKGGTDEP